MVPSIEEQHNVSLVSFTDMNERPGFKFDIIERDGTWYLYVAHGSHGWSVIDVTDPTEPEIRNFIEQPENTATGQLVVADDKMITSLEKPMGTDVDNYEEGAYIWDLSTEPTEPELLGQYETGGTGTHRNFYGGGDYAYMASHYSDFEPQWSFALGIVDISDPTNPEEVSRWWWPGQAPEDDEEPTENFYFHGPAYVKGDRAYLSYGRVGMVVLDVSDKTNPEMLGRVDFGDFGSWLGVHSAVPVPETDLVAVNTEAIREESPLETGDSLNYVVLVDASDPSDPGYEEGDAGANGTPSTGMNIVSIMPTPTPEEQTGYGNYHEKPGRFGPHNQHHYRQRSSSYKSNELLFVTYFNAGLRIFDVSDPLAPKEVGYFVPHDPETRYSRLPKSGLALQMDNVTVDSRGYIYCLAKNQGLFILESELT